jgi:hypothetical protein
MLVFRFHERYIRHFLATKKRRNPCPDYLILVLQQALDRQAAYPLSN